MTVCCKLCHVLSYCASKCKSPKNAHKPLKPLPVWHGEREDFLGVSVAISVNYLPPVVKLHLKHKLLYFLVLLTVSIITLDNLRLVNICTRNGLILTKAILRNAIRFKCPYYNRTTSASRQERDRQAVPLVKT